MEQGVRVGRLSLSGVVCSLGGVAKTVAGCGRPWAG